MTADRPRDGVAVVAAALGAPPAVPTLVVGTAPPAGRDLDLLVAEDRLAEVRRRLQDAGLVGGPTRFALLRQGAAVEVELVRPGRSLVAEREVEGLFARARPLPGHPALLVPSPADDLVLRARRLPGRPGPVADRHRAALRELLAAAEDPGALWHEASRLAPDAATVRGLALLRDLAQRDRRVSVRDAALTRAAGARRAGRGPVAAARAAATALRPARERPALVALSGLDGSGKSTAAGHLHDLLEELGEPTQVGWSRLGQGRRLRRLGTPVRRLLRMPLDVRDEIAELGDPTRPPVVDAYDEPPLTRGRRLRRQVPPLHTAWAGVVAVVDLLENRRSLREAAAAGASVVLRDRWTLDSLVQLLDHYAPDGDVRLPAALVRHLNRRPDAAFLLEVPAEEAARRKPGDVDPARLRRRAVLYAAEAPRLGVVPIDGTQPPDVVQRDLAERVWRTLRGL